jgi:dTMP kinase
MRGIFISFEGCEGSGKSTQAKLLAEALEGTGRKVVLTAEPGGTQISQRLREVLLDPEHTAMEPVTELLLYAAARRQHLAEKIIPALREGKVVITDRFSDSTRAYQGTARGLDMELIDTLDKIATEGLKPELTIILDLDEEEGLKRNRSCGKRDRLELEDVSFHKKVREGFLLIAKDEPQRVKIISASQKKNKVHKEIMQQVNSIDF